MSIQRLILLLAFSSIVFTLPSPAQGIELIPEPINQRLQQIFRPTYGPPEPPIQISGGHVKLAPRLQNDLEIQIVQARKKLTDLSQRLSLSFTEEIGMVYIHQGGNQWKLQFTFGGLELEPVQAVIVSTKQVFKLKKSFAQTKSIDVNGKTYVTSRSMRQQGPILHENPPSDLELLSQSN
jgi:hypothetical protein